MTQLPNIITLLRIAGSLSLLLCDVMGVAYWILELPQWLWPWAGVIVLIKVVNQLSALVMYRHCYFPHTAANKATGFLLFIAVPMTFYTVIPIAIVAAIATFAAIHEHYIITNMIKQI